MARASSRAVASKPARVKTAVMLSPESFQRLGAACLKEGLTQSEIVEALISRNLSGYVVSVRGAGFSLDRANPAATNDRPGDGAEVRQESNAA